MLLYIACCWCECVIGGLHTVYHWFGSMWQRMRDSLDAIGLVQQIFITVYMHWSKQFVVSTDQLEFMAFYRLCTFCKSLGSFSSVDFLNHQ